MDTSDNFESECELLLSVILVEKIIRLSLTSKVFLNVLLFFSSVIYLQDSSLMFPSGHGESDLVWLKEAEDEKSSLARGPVRE